MLVCQNCGQAIPAHRRKDSRYCGRRCRSHVGQVRRTRLARLGASIEALTRPV